MIQSIVILPISNPAAMHPEIRVLLNVSREENSPPVSTRLERLQNINKIINTLSTDLCVKIQNFLLFGN